jgi:putative transposase
VADAAPTASIGELCGLFGVTRQAYYQRQQQVGRDTLFDLLRREVLLVRRLKRKTRTTDSSHWLHKYPNLI